MTLDKLYPARVMSMAIATDVAAALNEDAEAAAMVDDWHYEAEEISYGKGRIKITDDNGDFVGYL